jgi:hypothetical protein
MKSFSFFLIFFLAFFFKASGQNHPPVAVNDTVYGFFNYPIQVHLLQNDYDLDGDSIYVYFAPLFTKINDTTWEFVKTGHSVDYLTSFNFTYKIKDIYGAPAVATVVFIFKAPLEYDSLFINNINALISPVGQHFWDLEETAHFEVPKGTGTMAVFSHQIWIGALAVDNQLHLAVDAYRSVGTDFTQGPISTVMDSTFDKKWNRVWKVNKQQIQYHVANWNNAGYQPIDAIEFWPAHGDVLLGQTADIAPFYDRDTNGVYDPFTGDYPLIRGDEAVFFIYNDSAFMHTESKSKKLGVEIHGMAYEYDRPNDSLLNNTLFLHYDILNRSILDFHDAYVGLSADFDLGNPRDDFIGSDVTNGMIYAYNGDILDEDSTFMSGNKYKGYGEHPPAIGLKVIGGPNLPADGVDNPDGGCDISINGLNFGDNIADNERFGLTNSIIPNSYNIYGDPPLAQDYYNFMKSILMGGHLIFGGNGSITTGGVGPECEYMFPGNSDTLCNWGTQGIQPNGGYNQNGKYWCESEVNNIPGDRQGLASIGPFSLNAGQSVQLDYCFTFARDYNGDNLSSVELLRERVAAITPQATSLISLPETYYSINEKPVTTKLKILPNPARNWIIVVSDEKSDQHFQVYDYNGKLIEEWLLHEGDNQLDIQKLKAGIYLLKSGSRWGKFVKM